MHSHIHILVRPMQQCPHHEGAAAPGFALATAHCCPPSNIPLPPPETPRYHTSGCLHRKPRLAVSTLAQAHTPCLVSLTTAPSAACAGGSSRHPQAPPTHHCWVTESKNLTSAPQKGLSDHLNESHCTGCPWQGAARGGCRDSLCVERPGLPHAGHC